MGYRVLLLAVSGNDPDAVHAAFGVTPTGGHEEFPESPVVGAALPSGKYLLYINDEITPGEKVFARLSKEAELLVCYANETVMESYVSCWENGTEKWSVWHNAQEGLTHLEAYGAAPPELKPIQESLPAEQEGVTDTDYFFDIPIELFAALGGLRYNEDIPATDPNPWQILARDK